MSNFNELDFSSENEDEAVSVNSTEPMDKVAKVVVKCKKPKKQSPPSESSENEQEAEQPKVPRKKAVVKRRKQAKPQEGARAKISKRKAAPKAKPEVAAALAKLAFSTDPLKKAPSRGRRKK